MRCNSDFTHFMCVSTLSIMKKENLFSSFKDTMIVLSLILAIVVVVGLTALITINNSYYSQFGDDDAQYFPFMTDFVLRFKANKLSFYSFSNYMGSSYFVDTYYVSFDIFSLLVVLLSYLMPASFAFGFGEYAKMFLGVLAFAYYLHLRKRGNKAVFFASLLYMVCGANIINQAFPIYYSLIFYLPLVAIGMEYFHQGKTYVLPLLVCTLVFYDYYNAYMCIIFAFIIMSLHYAIDGKEKCKQSYIKEFGKFVFFGILGVLMGAVVLIPSALSILRDTPKGSGIATIPDELLMFKDPIQYLRILGEIFTPAISTDYWGFSNKGWYSYINMHLSLYITVTGLLLALSIYFYDDRESLVYKVIFPLEIIIIFMPIWYMLFSGSTGTYTRWFVMITFLNLLITAKVIDVSDFNFYKHRFKSLGKNLIVLSVCITTLCLYVKKIYNTNIFNYLLHFGCVPIAFKPNPGNTLNFEIDMAFLFVAIGFIVVGTIACFIRKVNIMPYVLAVELVVGVVFFYMSPFRCQNFLVVDQKRNEFNDYLNTYCPSTNKFYRVFVDPQVDKGGDGQNFNRTQLQLTTFKNFHSWHTAVSHELTHLLYGSALDNNNSANLDKAYLDLQQMLGAKYIASNDKGQLGLPKYYEEVPGTRNNGYVLYENKEATPFVIYDTLLDTPYKGDENNKDYYLEGDYFNKCATLLNYLYYSGTNENVLAMPKSEKKSMSFTSYSRQYSTGNVDTPWDFVSGNYLAYKLDMDSNENIPKSGYLTYAFGYLFGTKFENVYIGYRENGEDKIWRSCFGSHPVCYYDELPTREVYLYVQNTTSMINRRVDDNANLELIINYVDGSYNDAFIKRQNRYTNQSINYHDSGFDVSFDKNEDKDIVVLIPVAYSVGFKCSRNYDIINAGGGMLGVFIPKTEIGHIEFTLKYEAHGLKGASLISAGAFLVYGGYLVWRFKIKHDEE